MKATRPEKNYEPVPAGNHIARLYQIIHLGTTSYEYMGEMKKADKVRLTFELCNEKKVFKEGEEPRPYAVSREFGLYMSKNSKLRPFVEGLIGTSLDDDEAYAFDLEDILGQACMLNVVHVEKGDRVYANIQNASPMPKGIKAPELFNDTFVIDVKTTAFEEIEKLPDFLKEKIKASEEYSARVKGPAEIVPEPVEKPAAKLKKPKILGGQNEADETNTVDVPF